MKFSFLLIFIFAVILCYSTTGDDNTDGVTIEWYIYYTNYETPPAERTTRSTIFTWDFSFSTKPIKDDASAQVVTPNRTHHFWYSVHCEPPALKPIWHYDLLICDEAAKLKNKGKEMKKQKVYIKKLQDRQYDEREAGWLWYIELFDPLTTRDLTPVEPSMIDKEPLEENKRYKRLECDVYAPIWKVDQQICKELYYAPSLEKDASKLRRRLKSLNAAMENEYDIREMQWSIYLKKFPNDILTSLKNKNYYH